MLACRRQNVLERISTRSSHTLVLEPIRLLILLSLHKQPLELVIKLYNFWEMAMLVAFLKGEDIF